MSDDYQIDIPQSFMALYLAPGRTKPREPRHMVAARYELCEDMANLLTEHAKAMKFSLGITEDEVLLRCLQGLRTGDTVVTLQESEWVVRRLAELLGWTQPEGDDPA